MRITVLILLMIGAVATLNAQPPHIMTIYTTGGGVDTISCNRIDPSLGITFSDNRMIVPSVTIDTVASSSGAIDSIIRVPAGQALSICIAKIDSITFPFKGGQPYQITQPSAGQIYHIGDTITVRWNFNPLVTGQKAYFRMSLDGGKSWKWLTNSACYMMYSSPTMAGVPCGAGVYAAWPYVLTNGNYAGTWKFKLTNPLVMPDATAESFDPVSDSVLINIHDYENTEQSNSGMFSIKP